ncbi:WD40 repeat-like protein [Dichomitus squalens]|uniref:WD40 repeat-like protein n=1 Tax=Dichomitus squalens TaxID=114155 RepID=A0A4Q9PW49_9APHY|nr:WD40 repeat-like protein [Dichomitus squalens]
MGKHARKKQKISDQVEVQPLGALAAFEDPGAKDEEELRLESFLFGSADEYAAPVHDDQPGFTDDVFVDDVFVDDGLHADPTHGTGQKQSVWTDPDDPALEVSLASDKRRRKLRDAFAEDTVDGREYECRLRRQFEKTNPTPDWATKARKRLHTTVAGKRRRVSIGSEPEEDSEQEGLGPGLDSLLSGTGSVVAGRHARVLPQGILAIERLRDANLSAKAEGEINVVQFHPSPQVPVLLTTSSDRRLRLFNVDGHTNPHLQTLHIPALPLNNATFHPGGTSVLLTGPRPFYYTYDLQTGTTQRSPRGLWGTTFTNTNQAAQDGSMEVCAFDKTGSVLAVAGRRGHVHLVDWRTGGGQVVGSVKMNAGAKSLWWSGEELLTLSEDSEVYVWDVGQRKCVRRWKDDGGYGSQLLGGDRTGQYLAIGSKVGFVNVYGSDAAQGSIDRPKALKTLGNLTTTITSLRFNHDSQLLAIASNVKKDQLRMVCAALIIVVNKYTNALLLESDTFAFPNRVLQLANIQHPARPCDECGFFGEE